MRKRARRATVAAAFALAAAVLPARAAGAAEEWPKTKHIDDSVSFQDGTRTVTCQIVVVLFWDEPSDLLYASTKADDGDVLCDFTEVRATLRYRITETQQTIDHTRTAESQGHVDSAASGSGIPPGYSRISSEHHLYFPRCDCERSYQLKFSK